MELFKKSDLILVREKSNKTTSYFIEPREKRDVLAHVNEVAYYLYDHYRTASLTEAKDISDAVVGKLIGWPTRKVSKYRVELQKANLIRKYREGTVTKLIVGMDRVALSNAGLPEEIQNQETYKQIKKQLGITTTKELVDIIDLIQQFYDFDQTGTNNDS